MKLSLRYRADRTLRRFVMSVMGRITWAAPEESVDLRQQEIKKVLLVRGIFRMGDAILATPAVVLLRKNFPGARIDFVGSRTSRNLFHGLPIDHHYVIERSFPKACWSYIALLIRLRSVRYDLAVDVSGSSAALGSFIAGFSGARFRAGLRGKWDRWFNLRFPRSGEKNKYRNLPRLIGAMGLQTQKVFPTLALSAQEKRAGRKRLEKIAAEARGPIAGVFTGGRRRHGKRWPAEKFLELACALRRRGARVVMFVGPEERELIDYFERTLGARAAVVFEPDPRHFAALVAGCELFVTCDSGPMHLACALRVKTVAIFLRRNFDRWGPPAELAEIVYRDGGPTVAAVMDACRGELATAPTQENRREIVNA